MAQRKLSEALLAQIRQRANYLCEYCHTNERWQYVQFIIDHITPRIAGGADEFENLALACFYCNRRKSTNQTMVDIETGEHVALFNPRIDRWSAHFAWSADGLRIIALTAIGRVTASLLDFNRERIIQIRSADVDIGRHPPSDDPILND